MASRSDDPRTLEQEEMRKREMRKREENDVLVFQTLTEDVHVQHAEEANAVARAECGAALSVDRNGGVVQPQLHQCR